MTPKRGEIWLATLNSTVGSEQAGTRPVLVFQNDRINRFTTTFLSIPLTSNLRRASLPSCVTIPQGEGGLTKESVALCHQLRVLDGARLFKKLGIVNNATLATIENVFLFTTGIL